MNMSTESINYRQVLSDLLERREKLDAARIKVDAAIVAIKDVLDEMPRESDQLALIPLGPPTHQRPIGPHSGKTIIGAAIDFLRSSGMPQETGAISRGLLAGGFRTESKSFYRTVYNTLNSNLEKAISRGKDGRWGLKEWGGEEN